MQTLRGALAVLLILELCCPAPGAPVEAGGRAAARPAYASTQIQGNERIVHALNRFTFGPRPGDVAAVRQIGLEQWFEQQLHPENVENTELRTRLAQFPAMQWEMRDLLFRMPPNPILRQVAQGRISYPRSGPLRAVYEDGLYRLQERQQGQKAIGGGQEAPRQTRSAAGATTGPADPPAPDAQAMALAGSMDQLDGDPDTAEILALPPDQRVRRLTAMQPAELESFVRSLRPPQRMALVADLSPDQRETVADLQNPQRLVAGELMATRLARDIYSDAQLEEVMTDFWLNHFNIYLRKNELMPYYLVSYERDVIRPHALGKFEDLLEAVAHSPAMLIYLDNAESMGPDSPAAERAKFLAYRRPNAKLRAPEGLNENYARELMELHTLGVNGGYTQADVIQVARVLTGWTVDRPFLGGEYQFNPNRHEPGAKKVMGRKIKQGGEKEGRELLHMLATSPATAHFLSRKLAIRFVSDDPPPALVDRMAKAYLASGGDIPTVLRTLFHSPEFWSTTDDRAKVKTPLEFVVSAVRASNADVQNYGPLVNALRQMGMPLYGCIPPSGYAWDEQTWVSTSSLVDRMNFALALAGNRFPGIRASWAGPVENGAEEVPGPEEEEARLETRIVPSGVSATTRSAVLEQFRSQMAQAQYEAPMGMARVRANFRAEPPTPFEREDQVLGGLLLGSPEFQRR
jgi:uncharacterized protein (DUF1800 family)